jgi:polyferredoxin
MNYQGNCRIQNYLEAIRCLHCVRCVDAIQTQIPTSRNAIIISQNNVSLATNSSAVIQKDILPPMLNKSG